MPAAYDYFDYPSYWKNRKYEHLSEVIALTKFLERIPKIENILELGAGYGRLTPTYYFRAKKILLTDPSAKLLKIARQNLSRYKNISFSQGSIDKIAMKTKKKFDLVILIRVMHHLKDINKAFKCIHKLTKKNGYLILEFANKIHFKANLIEFLKGNFTHPLEIFSKDIRSKRSLRKKTLPFYNFHPDMIQKILEDYGFDIIEKRSVSNIRHQTIKKIIPINFLLEIEKRIQKPFSGINFGPSIFILAKKIR